MCTAITYLNEDLYFGRTLDLEYTFGEEVVITPRNYPLSCEGGLEMGPHYGIIGMAHVEKEYPLYYDAVNEEGLCMAGLNFPGFARYGSYLEGMENVPCYAFIPWILGQCRSVQDVRLLLERIRLTDTPFSPELPSAQLHWIIADRRACITVEPNGEEIRVFDNPVGVLSNNPPFDDQLFQLRNFMHLSPHPPHNHFSPQVDLKPYSRGMGAMGLPGDLSSQSRFVRAAFTKLNSVSPKEESISQFFHIMETVSQTRGCCRLKDGSCEMTQYTSCCNAEQGIYYYTTYGNRRISGVRMRKEDLEGERLIRYPLCTGEDIHWING